MQNHTNLPVVRRPLHLVSGLFYSQSFVTSNKQDGDRLRPRLEIFPSLVSVSEPRLTFCWSSLYPTSTAASLRRGCAIKIGISLASAAPFYCNLLPWQPYDNTADGVFPNRSNPTDDRVNLCQCIMYEVISNSEERALTTRSLLHYGQTNKQLSTNAIMCSWLSSLFDWFIRPNGDSGLQWLRRKCSPEGKVDR